MESLEDAYTEACTGQSDMVEHVQTLRRLASQCQHVTEFGVRGGVSSVALLAGVMDSGRSASDLPLGIINLPKAGGTLVSYDVAPCAKTVPGLQRLGGDRFRFIQGNSLEVEIEPTDLLLIDTVHTGWHLAAELERHAGKVRKCLVMHDTEHYGRIGDDGGAGMFSALGRFLLENPQWRVQRHYPNCHGLTVLERWV